jgi:hypothetical protein
MFQLIESVTVAVTPELAQQFAAMSPCPGDRELKLSL